VHIKICAGSCNAVDGQKDQQDGLIIFCRGPEKAGADFVPITWDQAISEISDRLKAIVAEHGPRAYGYMGGGDQGCHLEAAMALSFMGGDCERLESPALLCRHEGV
jgi:hypothetical protein